MVEQGVDQGPVGVAGCWVDDEPCRLVHHQEMLVLEENAQGYVLGRDIRRPDFGHVDDDVITTLHPVCRSRLSIVAENPTGVDETANLGSGPFRGAEGEKAVQTLPLTIPFNPEDAPIGHRFWRRLIHRWRPKPATIMTTEMN